MKKYIYHTTFLAIVACLLWSSAFTGVKIGLKYQTPLQFAGIRFLIAGLLLLPLVIRKGRFMKSVGENFGFVMLVALLQVVLQYTFFYLGVDRVPASVSAMIVGSSPLFVAMAAHFSTPDDKMGMAKAAGIVLGILGVAVISLGPKKLPSGAEIAPLGILFLLLNNVTSGITNIVIARRKQPISPMVLTSSSLIIGGLLMFLISIPAEGFQPVSLPVEYFVALAWLSFLSAAAVTIWNTLLQRPNIVVSELNLWKFLIPVSGAILSWLVLPNESPNLVTVLGMLLIAFSLVTPYLPLFKPNRSK